MIPVMIHEGVTDRRDRGLKKPWGSMGRHAIVLNEPEQLRGPAEPASARMGQQGGGHVKGTSVCGN